MRCLFCGGQESNYRPGPDVNFICGTCVQLLLNADQSDLKRAHIKVIEKSYRDKASAIESFLEEEYYGETERIKSGLARKRPMRTFRSSRVKVR